MDWVEKVVLVTGGANGIGKAISQAFLNAGATVIVADVDAMNGEVSCRRMEKRQFECGLLQNQFG
jgi:NAD(P)-dependent dehydrogenase (short-subunit alcohol dehydrogenase family)